MTPTLVDAWALPGEPQPIQSGLINQTYRWGDVILQQLNTQIFDPILHEDTEAVTQHLAKCGLITPTLVRTRQGRLWHTEPDGSVWRVQTRVGTRTIDQITDSQEAYEAGALVARFHRATSTLDWNFRNPRKGVHNTPQHMETLRAALVNHSNHDLAASVNDLAGKIFQQWEQWTGTIDGPSRIIHGDLKISNIRFDGPQAVSLIDLDTLQRGTIAEELGDALRSWCSAATEDSATPTFSLSLFGAAMEGYCSHGDLSGPEWRSIVPGIQRITIELAARFAADALNESYFGWDHTAYARRGDHNLARATSQLQLAQSIAHQAADAQGILDRLIGSSPTGRIRS